MDWIHCNDCYKLPYSQKQPFFLSPCGRILCSDCQSTNSCAGKPCQKCRMNGYMTTQLRADLPSEIADFFRNSSLLLKRYIKVVDFQKRHRDALFSYNARERHRLSSMVADYGKLREAHQYLQQKYEGARAKIDSLVQENEALKMALENVRANAGAPPIHFSRHSNEIGTSNVTVQPEHWNRRDRSDVRGPENQITPTRLTVDNPTMGRSSTPSNPPSGSKRTSNSNRPSSGIDKIKSLQQPGVKKSTPTNSMAKRTGPNLPPMRLVSDTPLSYQATPMPVPNRALSTPLAGHSAQSSFLRPLPINRRQLNGSVSESTPGAGFLPRTKQSAFSIERVYSFISSATQQAKSNADRKTLNQQ